MNDEEYLRACGWTSGEIRSRSTSLAEAVEKQLAEDRARFAFVLHRTSPLVAAERGETAAVAALGAIMEEHRPGGDALTVTTPEDARRLFGEPMYEPGGAPSNAAAAAIQALKMQRPVVAVKVGEVPPDSRPVNDLAAVAVRINNYLNHLWFEETGRAFVLGIQKPAAHEEDNFVVVCYDAFCGVSFNLSERVARAYDAWLAAGNVGKHYEGDALRSGIEVKR